MGVKGGTPLPKAGFNAPPAEASTPRKQSAVWGASLLGDLQVICQIHEIFKSLK